MQNYEPGTIVPVGTKIVRTEPNPVLNEGEVYIVYQCDGEYVWLSGEEGWYELDCFAPYEEVKKEEDTKTDSLPTYVTLKDMPWISKGSVIVQRTDGTVINQADNNYSNNPSNYIIDDLNWLLKEHPEDFKKIN